MPFYIVQTIEDNKTKLSICPSTWLRQGVLSWPKRKAARKCKIEDSMPEETWERMLCQVKREFDTYIEAESQLTIMLNESETEEDECRTNASAKLLIENFNETADQLCRSMNKPNATHVEGHSNGSDFETMNMEPVYEYYQVVTTPNQATGSMEDAVVNQQQVEVITENAFVDPNTFLINLKKDEVPQALKPNKILMPQGEVTTKDLLNNQKLIFDNQTRIMKFLAKLNVKIEKLIPENNPITLSNDPVVTLSEELKQNPYNARISPIKNFTELQNLEYKLRDPETRKMYKDLYSVFCTPGKKGDVCAYQLIDVFFKREFLVECSWSGSSRGVGTKICIKLFGNILDLFFEIVHNCDPKYTVDKNHSFFKAVLKNASKRNNTKNERSSAPRNTPKRKPDTKTEKKTKDTNTEDSGTRDPVKQKKNEVKNPKTINTLPENKDITEDFVKPKTPKRKSALKSEDNAKRTKTKDLSTEDFGKLANIEILKEKRNKVENSNVGLNATNKDKNVNTQDDNDLIKKQKNYNYYGKKTEADSGNTSEGENKENEGKDEETENIAKEKMPSEDENKRYDVTMPNKDKGKQNDSFMPNKDEAKQYDLIPKDDKSDAEVLSSEDKSEETGTDGNSTEDENYEYKSDDSKSEEDENARECNKNNTDNTESR